MDEERLKIKPPMNRQLSTTSTNYTTNATLGSMSDDEPDDREVPVKDILNDEEANENTTTENTKRGQPPPNSCKEKQLWVDKYAPNKFSDLLSAENINRGVLNAIKVKPVNHMFSTFIIYIPSLSSYSHVAFVEPLHVCRLGMLMSLALLWRNRELVRRRLLLSSIISRIGTKQKVSTLSQ